MNYEQSNKAWIRLSQGTETEKTDQDEYWAKHKWTVSLPSDYTYQMGGCMKDLPKWSNPLDNFWPYSGC